MLVRYHQDDGSVASSRWFGIVLMMVRYPPDDGSVFVKTIVRYHPDDQT